MKIGRRKTIKSIVKRFEQIRIISCSNRTENTLNFWPTILNRRKVRRIGRQIDKGSASRRNQSWDIFALVDGAIIHKHISTSPKLSNQFSGNKSFKGKTISKILTWVNKPLKPIAPITETFLPRLSGFEPRALVPLTERANNLVRAKFMPDSSIKIMSLARIPRTDCQKSYRCCCTLSFSFSVGCNVFFEG